MRIGLYIPRIDQLRHFGRLLDYLCAAPKRFDPVIFIPGWPITKTGHQPYPDDFTEWSERASVNVLPSPDAMGSIIVGEKLDVMIITTAYLSDIPDEIARKTIEETREVGVAWIGIPYAFAEVLYLICGSGDAENLWDAFCVSGTASFNFVKSTLGTSNVSLGENLLRRFHITGSPEFDDLETYNQAAIRAKYGLPASPPIIFVSSAPTLVRHPAISDGVRDRVFKGEGVRRARLSARMRSMRYPFIHHYRRWLEAIRQIADRSGAFVVAKVRAKHQDPPYLADEVDLVIGDVSYHPFTTLELLSVSSLCVGFLSGITIEAAVAGVYSVNAAYVPEKIIWPIKHSRDFSRFFLYGPKGIWNWPGVSETVNGVGWGATRQLRAFSERSLEDFAIDRDARREFLKTYMDQPDNASAAIVRIAEGIVHLRQAENGTKKVSRFR